MRARLGVGFGCALACTFAAAARAQDVDPHTAVPERPTVATHAYTVAPGWLELESGLEFDRLDQLHVFSTPTSLKLGLASHLQLEATTAWIAQSDSGTSDRGMGDLVLSLKWRLADGLPILGDFAIQPAIRFPTGLAVLGADATVGSILIISSNHFGPVEVDANVGLFARLNDRETAPPTSTLWTVSAGTSVTGRLGWVLEIYGFPGTTGPAGQGPLVGLLTGPTWTVHPWFVVDTGIIIPLDGPQAHSAYVGLTWNIGRVWGTPVSAPSR